MPNTKNPDEPNVTWEPSTHSWTWKEIVRRALAAHDGTATLSDLHKVIERHPRTKARKHWQAKIRQQLEASDEFLRVDRGTWSFASGHDAKTVGKLRELRRKLYPKRSESEG